MFHDIPESLTARMHELEQIDERDREDGTAHLVRLRQIPPETGRFLALLAASAPDGPWIEIGTSAGYSTLWLTLACRERNQTLTTFEILSSKAALAEQTFVAADVLDVVTLVNEDFLSYVDRLGDIAFCFLDAEKDVYAACYDAILPRLVSGGLLVADNAISHHEDLKPMIDAALADERVDAAVVSIGKGELVCRKRSPKDSS
jgi:predicted O-methyltransferase YrrM